MGGEALSNLSIEVRDGAGETTRVDLARTFNLYAVVRLTQSITQLHAINLGVKLQETSLGADRERERAARLTVTREVKRACFECEPLREFLSHHRPRPPHRPRHPRRQRHPTLQRLRHHPYQHHLPRRGAGEVEDDEGVGDGGLVGADADAGGDGGDLVAREDADGSGGASKATGSMKMTRS